MSPRNVFFYLLIKWKKRIARVLYINILCTAQFILSLFCFFFLVVLNSTTGIKSDFVQSTDRVRLAPTRIRRKSYINTGAHRTRLHVRWHVRGGRYVFSFFSVYSSSSFFHRSFYATLCSTYTLHTHTYWSFDTAFGTGEKTSAFTRGQKR